MNFSLAKGKTKNDGNLINFTHFVKTLRMQE